MICLLGVCADATIPAIAYRPNLEGLCKIGRLSSFLACRTYKKWQRLLWQMSNRMRHTGVVTAQNTLVVVLPHILGE